MDLAEKTKASAEELVSDGLMSTREALAFLGVGRTKLEGLISAGDLPVVRLGGSRCIPRRALVRFLAARLVGGPIR